MSLLSVILPKQIEGAISTKWSTILAYGVGLLGCVAVAPVVFLAIKGIVGLVIAALFAWVSLKLAPVVGLMVGNLSLKLIRWESRQNPGDTMRQNYIKRERQLNEDDKLAEDFVKDLEEYRPKVAEIQRNYPEDAASFLRHLQGMEETRDLFREAIQQGREALAVFAREIKRVDIIWDATKTGTRLGQFAQRIGRTDAIAQIQNDEAIKAAQKRMTDTFANLDSLRYKLRNATGAKEIAPRLGNSPSPALPQDVVDAKVIVPASTKYN